MRKHDVFGKKISSMRPFYAFLAVVVLVFAGFFLIREVQNGRIHELEAEKAALEADIRALLDTDLSPDESLVTVGDVHAGVPEGFFRYNLEQDVETLLMTAGLQPGDETILIADEATYPADVTLADDVNAVRIDLSFTAADADEVIDLLEVILADDRLYDVTHVDVTMLVAGDVDVSLTFFAFYRT